MATCSSLIFCGNKVQIYDHDNTYITFPARTACSVISTRSKVNKLWNMSVMDKLNITTEIPSCIEVREVINLGLHSNI
ncbi:hypothetical protein FRX31_032610 [Thalictrum thalictroides]|uniref:Uncharacterized protein n=1 Tax=Thalictrum thalictroides TaxID=46969 RepID=A0A7J6V0L2_THATH|nr:hypothetical protein FRX31_032610 [Thalictrum thalictroides]